MRYYYLLGIAKVLGLLDGSVVVDCGCSNGDQISLFKKAGFQVTGYDIDKRCVIKSIRKSIHAIEGDIRKLTCKDNFCDLFICSETLEHINHDDTILAVKEICRVTKPNGLICITVPADSKKCLANKNHEQYLSLKDLITNFYKCVLIHESVYFKDNKNGTGNIVVFFRNQK